MVPEHARPWHALRRRTIARLAAMLLVGCGAAASSLLTAGAIARADDGWVSRSPAALQPSESATDMPAQPKSAAAALAGANDVHSTRLKWRAYHAAGSDTSSDAGSSPVHHDPNLLRAQALAPADAPGNPFGDEPVRPKSAAPTPLLPSEAPSVTPTLPSPRGVPTTPAPAVQPQTPLPGNSGLFPDTLGPNPANPSELPTPAVPNPTRPNPRNGNGNGQLPSTEPYQPRSDFLGPNALNKPTDTSCSSSNQACADEVATLKRNTVDKIGLDIVPPGKAGDDFPCECVLGAGVYEPRSWPELTYTWKAAALCHKPLYFEEVQSERYGHSHGPFMDPLVSAAHFFVTIPLLPYYMGVDPPWECQYSLGYYRPGSCAPFMEEPFPLSMRGAAVEAGAITGAAFVLP
jgi:hypothetical protein